MSKTPTPGQERPQSAPEPHRDPTHSFGRAGSGPPNCDRCARIAELQDRLDELTRILAATSHDLRQPLSALSLYLRTLENKLPEADKAVALDMRQCLTGLNELLSNVLNLSKLEAGATQPAISDFSLDSLLERVVASLGPLARHKRLILRVRDTRRFGRTDPILLQRIMMNLVSNAIRYTDAGGVLIALRRRFDKTWLEVWDTGVGIRADQTSEIFEEFRQLGNYPRDREKGTGIGLTIVAKTAALLGLQVRVESRVDRGSVFAIEVPLGSAVPTVPHMAPALDPKLIVLVEDNRDVTKAFSYAMTEKGHRVVATATFSDALEELADRRPDIVVADYRLAGRLNGFDVIAAMRDRFGSDLPAMLITGDTDPDALQVMTQRGVAVEHKPLDLDRVFATLSALVPATQREREG